MEQAVVSLPLNRSELLNNLAEHYHRVMMRRSEGREYLAGLGLFDESLLARFNVGYADGSALDLAGEKGDVRRGFEEMRLIDRGREYFEGCVVTPVFDLDDRCVDLYGLRIVSQNGEPADLYTPGRRRGVFNWKAFTEDKTIILTDTILNALSMIQAGYRNAVALSGTEGLTADHVHLLKLNRPKRVILAFRMWEWGERMSQEVAEKLAGMGVPTGRVMFPVGSDATAFLQEKGKPALDDLVRDAEPVRVKTGACSVSIGEETLEFVFGELRRYVARPVELAAYRMKVNLRAVRDGQFHVDVFDLYASKSRSAFCRAAGRLFSCESAQVERDMAVVIERVERYSMSAKRKETRDDEYKMTQEEEDQAAAFLKRADLLDEVVRHLDVSGYVGEDTCKKIGYLITISRKLDSPLSGVLISTAGAGKSKLMEHLSAFVPPEDVVWYTRITPQALYYAEDRSLKHKLIVACEEEGLTGANYSIRELISSKKLRMAAPVKDPITGRQKTVDYEVEGPVAILFSTEEEKLDHATMTRLYVMALNESRSQTRRVQAEQRSRRTLDGVKRGQKIEDIRRLHQNAQRLLRPLVVVNPYASDLTFPDHHVLARREQDKYLSLIEALAFLHQYQRPVKTMEIRGEPVEYIEVELSDIEKANELMAQMMGHSFEELRSRSRELLLQIHRMVAAMAEKSGEEMCEAKFNRRDIREFTGWTDHQVRVSLRRLVDLQYILPSAGRRGQMYRYELAHERLGGLSDGKSAVGLMDVADLRRKFAAKEKVGG